MNRTLKSYYSALAGLLFLFLIGCKDDKPTPSPATNLQKVSGDNQKGWPGEALTEPLKVKLLDQNGTPEANKTVEFAIIAGSGTLSTNRATTDQNGEVQVIWTLGSTITEQKIKAYQLDGNNQPVSSTEVEFTAKFKAITVAGGNGSGTNTNQLNDPQHVFVDANGNIYITDRLNARIQKWIPGASSGLTVAGGNGPGPGANQLNVPGGIFIDGQGKIYIADSGNDRIQKWEPGASSGVTVAGGNGDGSGADQLSNPTDIVFDANGNMFIADERNARVQKWAPGASSGTTMITVSGNGPVAPRYVRNIALDPNGNIYVVDTYNHCIQKWTQGATTGITVAGQDGISGSDADQLGVPRDVFIDATGNIYVADYGNNRIQKWAPGATSGTTVAGGNGPGFAAKQFDRPFGVFVDAGGNIFVADLFNNRIQKWLP